MTQRQMMAKMRNLLKQRCRLWGVDFKALNHRLEIKHAQAWGAQWFAFYIDSESVGCVLLSRGGEAIGFGGMREKFCAVAKGNLKRLSQIGA